MRPPTTPDFSTLFVQLLALAPPHSIVAQVILCLMLSRYIFHVLRHPAAIVILLGLAQPFPNSSPKKVGMLFNAERRICHWDVDSASLIRKNPIGIKIKRCARRCASRRFHAQSLHLAEVVTWHDILAHFALLDLCKSLPATRARWSFLDRHYISFCVQC